MTDKLSIVLEADELLALLGRALAQLSEPTELMQAIGAQLETNVQSRFESQVDSAGQPWAQLASATLKTYNKKYKGAIPGSLLKRTGLMRASLAANASSDAVEVGYSVDYAIFHVTGTKHMPRRDSLFATIAASGQTGTLGAGDEADIVALTEDFLRSALGN
jgi:phage virion morphogenesis protein